MWEKVEVLETHPDFGADLVDVLNVRRQHRTVDFDPAFLMLFQGIDTADHS